MQIRNFDTGQELYHLKCPFVRALLPLGEKALLVACYDEKEGGLKIFGDYEPPETEHKNTKALAFPAVANPPVDSILKELSDHVNRFKNKLGPGDGLYLADDWQTQGDWIGRYGRSYALLCGAESHEWTGEKDAQHTSRSGRTINIHKSLLT